MLCATLGVLACPAVQQCKLRMDMHADASVRPGLLALLEYSMTMLQGFDTHTPPANCPTHAASGSN